jgi:hypothetical protein
MTLPSSLQSRHHMWASQTFGGHIECVNVLPSGISELGRGIALIALQVVTERVASSRARLCSRTSVGVEGRIASGQMMLGGRHPPRLANRGGS